MSARVIPLTRLRDKRIDDLAKVLTPVGPKRRFLDASSSSGAVRLDIGGLEVWSTPTEAREFALRVLAAAREAEG